MVILRGVVMLLSLFIGHLCLRHHFRTTRIKPEKNLCGPLGDNSPANAYRKYHDEVLTGKKRPQILIFECMKDSKYDCGGQSDRFRGIIVSLFIAACTNRALMININAPYIFENILYPNNLAWNLTAPQMDMWEELRSIDYIEDEVNRQRTQTVTFHPLIPELRKYMESKSNFPLVHLVHNLGSLKMFLKHATSPIIRVQTNIDMYRKEYAQQAFSFMQRAKMKPHQLAFVMLEQVQAKTLTGCSVKFLFVPSSPVVARLHASALSLATQVKKQQTNNVRELYIEAIKNEQLKPALMEFTRRFYENWMHIPSQHTDFAQENIWRDLLTKILRIQYNEHNINIKHIVGIHYRIGGSNSGFIDTETRGDPLLVGSFEEFTKTHLTHKTSDWSPNNTLIIYISDNSESRTNFRNALQEFMYSSPSSWVPNSGAAHIQRSEHVNPYQAIEVFTEFLVLGFADSLILTNSGYGRLGYQLPFKTEAVRSLVKYNINSKTLQLYEI